MGKHSEQKHRGMEPHCPIAHLLHLLVSYDVQVGSEALQEGSQIGLHLPEREGGGGAAGSGDHPGLEGMGEQWRRPRGGGSRSENYLSGGHPVWTARRGRRGTG